MTTGTAKTPEEIKEFVRRAYEEIFKNGNLQAAEEYMGPDFFNYAGPQIGRTVRTVSVER